MYVLVAAADHVKSDGFSHAESGELVRVAPRGGPCGNPVKCGYGRSFTGLSSHMGTTVAVAEEVPDTRDQLVFKFLESAKVAGYGEDQKHEEAAVDLMLAIAKVAGETQPKGTLLEWDDLPSMQPPPG